MTLKCRTTEQPTGVSVGPRLDVLLTSGPQTLTFGYVFNQNGVKFGYISVRLA